MGESHKLTFRLSDLAVVAGIHSPTYDITQGLTDLHRTTSRAADIQEEK